MVASRQIEKVETRILKPSSLSLFDVVAGEQNVHCQCN